jgi:hypothetical protein
MATYDEALSSLNKSSILTRESWGENQCIFLVVGNLLAPSFYEHYGVGFDKLPIHDTICYSTDQSVVLGWLPSNEDVAATDWVVTE